MRIALLSFEFPPAVAIGGIGTYAGNAARMLAAAGHEVVVFAAGAEAGRADGPGGAVVRRVRALDRRDFAEALVPALVAAHREKPFDVIEAPEIGPEGAPAFAALPGVARVVKLHTPTFLVGRVGWDAPPPLTRLRFWAASLLRGRWRTLRRPAYDRTADPEYRCTLQADEIAAPSRAIAELLKAEWSLPAEKVHVYPLPFTPPSALLALPPPSAIRVVGFLGRLEPRKGVLEIVRAMPQILREAPDLRFVFIGPSWPYQNTDMRTWIARRHPDLVHRIDFVGAVKPDGLAAALAPVDAVLLPSRWENFPFACWEALAAARAVIGSREGGMAEVIEEGVSGLLVDPREPASIADAVLRLVRDPAAARRMAAAGRDRVTALLDPARVLPLQIAGYERAIARARLRKEGAS
jgi:glycosyltransferase involved in cell wall biosynthesis